LNRFHTKTGTGAAAVFLKEQHGVPTNSTMDGCDLSQGMLDQAQKRNCYRKLIKSDFHCSNCETDHYYDIVLASGVFAPGQAPPSAFDEFLRLLTTGGYAVFTIRCGYYDSHEGEAHRQYLEDLVQQKKWTVVAKTEEDYLPNDGVKAYVFVMKKL
jgi:ubiquinone/menaquinone biosynthesis C-methylase UbiE